MALAPQITPSIPAIISNVSGFPVSLTIVNRKNSTVKLLKTNCSERLVFSVPKNISRVNMPHMKKYAAIAVSVAAATAGDKIVTLGSSIRITRYHHNSP